MDPSRLISADAVNDGFEEVQLKCLSLVNSIDLQDKLAGVTALGAESVPDPGPETAPTKSTDLILDLGPQINSLMCLETTYRGRCGCRRPFRGLFRAPMLLS